MDPIEAEHSYPSVSLKEYACASTQTDTLEHRDEGTQTTTPMPLNDIDVSECHIMTMEEVSLEFSRETKLEISVPKDLLVWQ